MKYVAIDIETAEWGYPCEIALVEIRDGGLNNPKSLKIKPSCYPHMNPEMQAIHGITSEQLRDCPTLKDLWGEISDYIIGATLVGHNIRFDIGAIKKELQQYGITVGAFPCVCTLQQARKHLNLTSYKLDNVCSHLRIKTDRLHRAQSDAEAAAKVFIRLPKDGIKIIHL
jgi:DNA polymerase III epsilon subunit family exonuclease